MATITEFVILATGWKYQQVVCLPKGMGVTFFGIGPIGATILAVELLKLPLAIWTASRQGMQKVMMLAVGLPLICILTFQLVKDMAVYEMGVALAPASQMLEQATKEEIKISQLQGELAAIDSKKTDRDRKLSELAGRKAKQKADLEESLKRNDDTRQDAISLTDYQKKELADVEARQATIIAQFNADTAQITKAIADLRARRESEVGRATKWNAEEARIENAYKVKMADYANKKAAYEKEKQEYASANFLKRQLMKEPVDPGVAPVREVNTVLKPTEIQELDTQIQAKETELANVNNQRRIRVAQVEDNARLLREQFATRSSTKREESDRKRAELLAAHATSTTQWTAEEKDINQSFETAAQKSDRIHAELDDSRKKAEGFYEAREAAIKNTQVHRIATTVEIVRGLFKGQRPISITATAKERGDLYTDQISMVRIYVYPVLAFIVAFLPTLMVEIGFSTIFQPEQKRPQHRLGFLGRRMHDVYIRAGRFKMLRAERMAKDAANEIAARNLALASTKSAAEKALAEKDAQLNAAQEIITAATTSHSEQLQRKDEEFAEQSKAKEAEWVAKLASMADSVNRLVVEKDALRDFQKSEVERQIQMRQNAWSDRLTQVRQELDDQRTAFEADRTALMQTQHAKLMELSEDCKNQIIQARRQVADAELAAVEASAKLTHDLKDALHARDTAESQAKQQVDSFSQKLSQAKEEAARELEKANRQEKHRLERQQLEFSKTLRQREEDFEHRLKQCQQELSLGFDARLAEAQNRLEQEARRREAELERQLDARALDVDARWKQEVQQREDVAQFKLKQREQQLQAQAEARISEVQAKAEEEFHSREAELERQAESRVRAIENRLNLEAQQKEELVQTKSRQREQQWQVKLDTARAEAQAQIDELTRRRDTEGETALRDLETRLRKEMQQKDETAQAGAKQREQDLVAQLTAQAEARHMAAQTLWETESEKRMRTAVEPLKALLSRAEKDRDEAKQAAIEAANQVQTLEKRLNEASSFLNTWRNGKSSVGVS